MNEIRHLCARDGFSLSVPHPHPPAKKTKTQKEGQAGFPVGLPPLPPPPPPPKKNKKTKKRSQNEGVPPREKKTAAPLPRAKALAAHRLAQRRRGEAGAAAPTLPAGGRGRGGGIGGRRWGAEMGAGALGRWAGNEGFLHIFLLSPNNPRTHLPGEMGPEPRSTKIRARYLEGAGRSGPS